MNNPLRQYFRRPALYLKLPSGGKFYPTGALNMPSNGELPVFPMTAIDEITSKTPDALFNGTAVADIVKSCLPDIKDPWAIPSIDIDAILIAIRTATNGNEFEITSKCPKCETENSYGINLVQLLTEIHPGGYENILEVGELKFTFKPLPYSEVNKSNISQFELQREIEQLRLITDDDERNVRSSQTMKKLTEINMQLIASNIHSIELPNEQVTDKVFITEYLHQCDKNTYETIRSHIVKLREDSTTKPLRLKCSACSHEYEQSLALNVTDFFG